MKLVWENQLVTNCKIRFWSKDKILKTFYVSMMSVPAGVYLLKVTI